MGDDTIYRQAAIDALEEPCKVPESWTDEYAVGERAQWEKDVKALNSLPSAERREGQLSECEYWDDESNFCTLNRPSAERHGRWIKKYSGNYLCSVCGAWYRTTDDYGNIIDGEMTANYCESCGAKMDEVSKDE